MIYKLKIKYFVEEKSGEISGSDFKNGLDILTGAVLVIVTGIERRHKIRGFYRM